MPTRCQRRTRPPPSSSPPLANPSESKHTHSVASWLFCNIPIPFIASKPWTVQLKQSSFLGSKWLLKHPYTTTSSVFLSRLHVALTFLTPRQSDPIWSVWRGPFSITSLIKSSPGTQAQGWAGKDLGGKNLHWAKEKIKLQLTVGALTPSHHHHHCLLRPSFWCPGGVGGSRGWGQKQAQWWLRLLVIIAGQAYSTVSSVPSHLIPDTVLPSTETHQNLPSQAPSSAPSPPCWKSTLHWCLFFLKGQRWVLGSTVFPGVQINLGLVSSTSSTGLFDESVGQWHALAVMPWSLAFSPCHFPPPP